MLQKHMKNMRGNTEMNSAIDFTCLQEPRVNLDTIPKPVGLGFRGPRKELRVRSLSGIPSGVCPDLVRVLAGTCLANIRSLSGISSGLCPGELERYCFGAVHGREI